MEEELDGKISTSAIQVDRAGEIEAYNQKRIGELKDCLTQIRAQQDFYAKKAQEADEKLKQLEDATNGLILSGISSLSGLPVDVSKLGKGDFADQAKTIAIGMIENRQRFTTPSPRSPTRGPQSEACCKTPRIFERRLKTVE